MRPSTRQDLATRQHLDFDLDALAGLGNYYGWIFEEIRSYLGDRLVEIGAGIGTFTDVLAGKYLSENSTARLEAYEPDPHLFRQFCKRLAPRYPALLQTRRLVLTEGYFHAAHESYDTILMINVLEHISDDQATLRALYQALTRDGTLIIYSPAMPWLYSPHDESVGHYRRYTKPHLNRLLRAENFEVVRANYMDVMGVLPWYVLNVLGGATTLNPRLARLYDKWCIPMTRRLEGIKAPFVGKNVLMVGRKRT